MKNIAWLDNGLWEYYTQELDRILCGTVESDEHKELVSIYSHYLQEENEYCNLIFVVCVRLKESRGDNRTIAIGLIANLFDVSAESIFKIYDECKENADQYISIMPNMREISNFLDTSQS